MTNDKLRETEEFKTECLAMLYDLESNKVEIKKTNPIDHTGRCHRYADGCNPQWYSKLFLQYHNGKRDKKSRSIIRRCRVLKALKKMSEGIYHNAITYNVLIDEVRERLYEGYYIEEECFHVPPVLFKEGDKPAVTDLSV